MNSPWFVAWATVLVSGLAWLLSNQHQLHNDIFDNHCRDDDHEWIVMVLLMWFVAGLMVFLPRGV